MAVIGIYDPYLDLTTYRTKFNLVAICCTNPKMPWFMKTYNETTTDDIELRVCGNQGYSEDTPLDIIKLYVC